MRRRAMIRMSRLAIYPCSNTGQLSDIVEAMALRELDLDQFADQGCICGKMHCGVIAHSAGDKRGILMIDLLHQNLLDGTGISLCPLSSILLGLCQKAVEALLDNFLGSLVLPGPLRSGSTGSRRVDEGK